MSTKPKPGVLTQVPVKDLKPDPNQPRKSYDEKALKQFAADLKLQGIAQPLIIRDAGGQLLIVHGERRWRAAKLADLKTVPCLLSEEHADAIARGASQVAENTNRESLAPLDLAEWLDGLRQSENLSHNELTKKLQERGLTEAGHAKVRQLLDLVLIPDWAKKLMREGTLSATAAHCLVGIVEEPEVMKSVKENIEDGLRWRDEATAQDVKRTIQNARHRIEYNAKEEDRRQKQLLKDQEEEQRKKEGKLSKAGQRELQQQQSSVQRRKTQLEGEKIAAYLDTWLRAKMVLVPPGLPLGRLQALALWMACGAPEDTVGRLGGMYTGHANEGDAVRHTMPFMKERKLGDLPTFLALDEKLSIDIWQEMAVAAVQTMTPEQLRSFAHWLQIDLLAIGYEVDEDYLNLLRKSSLLKLAKIVGIENANGTMKALKAKLLLPDGVKAMGVPADLEKEYRKAPKVKESLDVDLEAQLGPPPTDEEAEELGNAAAGALATRKKKGKAKAKGKAKGKAGKKK